MKVLITGATGFVGQHLINILKKDHQIIGLDRSSPQEKLENIVFQSVDITNKEAVLAILDKEKPDAIVHLAAIAITWRQDAQVVFKVNFNGTLNLYQAVIELKEKDGYNPKIIFISSADVYGKVTSLENISEQALLNPLNFYATSKVAADRLSYQVAQTYKLNTLIIRPFTHTGPGQQKGFFIPDMASQIVELEKNNGGELLVGNLESTRDYLDVRDVVRAYKYFIENDFTPGDVFNVCSSRGIKISELLDLLLKNSTKKIVIKQDPTRFRLIDTPFLIGNNQKLINATGWKPEIPIEQTLKDSLDYWRNMWKDNKD
jgi:GDP-4-dehydro-6-deoxy-D-mannose reductase